jgi:competence protein ComEC
MDEHPLYAWGVGVCVGAWMAPALVGTWGPILVILATLGAVRWRAAVLLGWAIGALAGLTTPEGPDWDGPISVIGTVVGAPSSAAAELDGVSAARSGGPWIAEHGRIVLRFPEGAPVANPGERWMAFGAALPPRADGIPGQPDAATIAARSGVKRVLHASRAQKLGVATATDTPFATLPYGAILRALALGDRAAMPEDQSGLFRRTGTTHVLSISGLHVALVAAATGGVLAALLRAASLVRRTGFSTAPALITGALTGVTYAYLTGASAAAQRSAIMLAASAVAHALGHQVRPLDLLGVAAAAIVLPDPAAVASPGFLLSFGGMIGLFRVTATLTTWLPPDLPRPLRWLCDGLLTTLGATIGTFPATAVFLGTLSPTAPIANLLIVPWYSVIVTPAALLGLLPGGIGALSAWLGDRAIALSIFVLGHLDAAPIAMACTTTAGFIAAIPLLHPRRESWVAVTMALILGSRDTPERPARAVFLDIGQGDSAYLELPDGDRWLVDGGPPSTTALRYLRQEGIGHLDVVVASHGHPDHIGGLLPVLEAIDVDELWIPDLEGMTDLVAIAQRRGTTVRVKPLERLHPSLTYSSTNTNNRSLVLRVDLGGVRLLLPGDVEADAEDHLPDDISADILKVPHHGSHTSSTARLLDRVRPSLAVVSCGTQNRFGHPHADVVARYRDYGIPLLRTDALGTVELQVDRGLVRMRHGTAATGWSLWDEVPIARRWWEAPNAISVTVEDESWDAHSESSRPWGSVPLAPFTWPRSMPVRASLSGSP